MRANFRMMTHYSSSILGHVRRISHVNVVSNRYILGIPDR